MISCICWCVLREGYFGLVSASVEWLLRVDAKGKRQESSGEWQANYRKRFLIVREVLSVREREIQTDRERRKWRHHCRDKIGDEFTLSLAKNSLLAMSLHFPLPKIRTSRFSLHTSRLSLHGEVYHCGAENRNEFTLSIAKIFFALFVPLFQMARAARRVIETPRQMIKSYPVLFCSSHRKNESN